MKAIPFILITGFLGSGKTTLLKRFLNHFADDKKIAVIQNEFADANVDGKELRDVNKSFEIMEINKGSVFCVCLLSNFVQSLNDLIDSIKPEAIVLEATGLADPITIGQIINSNEMGQKLYLSHVWSIVDATTFLEMEAMVQRMVHQVRIADTVLINKTDGLSKDKISEVENRIQALNPFAQQIKTSYCELTAEQLNDSFTTVRNPQKDQPFQSFLAAGPPSEISSAVLRSTNKITKNNLMQFLEEVRKNAYRIKGYVNLDDGKTVSVQSCFGKTELTDIDKEPGPSELIALGPGIVQQEFIDQFNKLAD